MGLTKEQKEQPENAKTEEEAKEIMEEADHEMTDEEVEQLAGGSRLAPSARADGKPQPWLPLV